MRRSAKRTRSTLPVLPSLAEPPTEARRMAREGRSAVMAGEWLDPIDSGSTAARTAPRVKGHRTFCPLRYCIRRHGPASNFSEAHVVAADLLRGWGDGAAIGFSVEKTNLPIGS